MKRMKVIMGGLGELGEDFFLERAEELQKEIDKIQDKYARRLPVTVKDQVRILLDSKELNFIIAQTIQEGENVVFSLPISRAKLWLN